MVNALFAPFFFLFYLIERIWFFLFDRLICYHLLKFASQHFDIRFLNLGYVPQKYDDIELERTIDENILFEEDRPHVALYEKTLSQLPSYPSLSGMHVLDIGCGQGGGVRWMKHAHPELFTVHGVDRIVTDSCEETIVAGEATAIPFPSSTFNIVVNVESSHLYDDVEGFFKEVSRVLCTGGFLCWADLRYADDERKVQRLASRYGLQQLNFEEITPGVLEGIRETAKRYDHLLHQAPLFIKLFASSLRTTYCAPGTSSYKRFVNREKRYWAALWQKVVK